MYVEYRRKNKQETFRDFGGRINPGRNYFMFGLLSKGVRSNNENGIEPKGMPDYESLGFASRNDNQLYISESEGEDYATRDQAEKWVSNGSSYYTDDRKLFVSHPDWHSHSWVGTDEYKSILDRYKEHPDTKDYAEPEYEAILSAMQKFEDMGFESRIVFWFDN